MDWINFFHEKDSNNEAVSSNKEEKNSIKTVKTSKIFANIYL